MNLVIVESPTKAKTLKRFLGDEYRIEASMGHVRDLPKSKLGVDVTKDFEPEYVKSEGKSATVSTLKKLSKEASKIYLATDPDREGEAISWHIKALVEEGLPSKKQKDEMEAKFVRSTFHEITKDAILHAIDNPIALNMDLVDAQQARRVVDRLVGYYLSPVLWKKVRRGLSAGRVQSVALRLIVEREKEIKEFVPEEYWEVYVHVQGQGEKAHEYGEFILQLSQVGDKPFAAKNKAEVDPILADLDVSTYIVSGVDALERRRQSLAPFTTSTLQQAGSNRLGFSSKKTMKLAQDLYEQGLITYHRTDSVNLAASSIERARAVITNTYGPQYIPASPRIFVTKSKNAQEAHEAIRPSNIEMPTIDPTSRLESDHQRLYDLIYRRFLACQMSDALYDQTTISVVAKPEGKTTSYLLRVSGSVLLFDGWSKLFDNKEDVVLPKVTVNEVLAKEKIDAQQKFTQPKPRYNDASLVKTLEKLGIGRPSTYASIISVLEIRGYVERLAKAFVPTSIGTTVCEFLVKNFPKELDYTFTAGMEDDLDAIARGEKEWKTVVKTFFNPFETSVKEVTQDAERMQVPVEEFNGGVPCPTCNEGKLVIRTGRFGKFISCRRYPECTFTGKLIFKVDGVVCPECNKGEVRQRQSKRGTFFGCSRYPECKWSNWQKPGTPENLVIMSYVPNPPKAPKTPEELAKEAEEKKAGAKKSVVKKAVKKTVKAKTKKTIAKKA